jgi:hypothetical protein
MTEEQIAKIKENASTIGAVLKLHGGTRIYCESIEQAMKVLTTRKFSDAAYVEYTIEERDD